jgi:hypothetical protein
VKVAVRIIVYEDGAIRGVLDSPLDQPTNGENWEVFRAAVEQTVWSWRYTPATIRTFADGEDLNHDGKPDYPVMVEERPIRTYLDLRFTFEVVNGRGRVQVGPDQ